MDDWDDSFDLSTDLDFVSGLPSGSFSSEDRFREEEENENESFDSRDDSEEGVWGDEDAAAEGRNREELDQEYNVGSAVKGVLCASFKSMSLGRPHPSTIGTQLGSRRKVPVALVEDDWDTEFQSPPTSLVRHVSSQSSFTSQISDHSEDHPLRQNNLMSAPDKRLASSQVIDDNNDFDDADFDLPDQLSRISLSPLLSRPSILLLSDHIHAPVATHLQPPTRAKLVSPLLTPYRSRSITSSPSASNDVDSDDDEEFWEGMILPSFFSGGPGQLAFPPHNHLLTDSFWLDQGALTPPTSDGETSMQSGRRVDLQAMLKQKLDQRNEMVEKARSRLPIRARVTSVKLDSYKERKEDKEVDVGLDVGELGAKLTNRINRPPSSLLPVRGRHRSQTTPTQQRRNITLALSRTPSAPDAFTPPSRRNPSMTNKIPVAPLPPSSASVAFKERAKSRIPRFNDQTPRPQRSIPRIETTLSTPPVALPPSPTLSPMAPAFSAFVSSKVSHQHHQSNPTTPTSSSTRLFNGQRTPTTASRASNLAQPQTTSPIKGSTSRLMNPTAASLAKSRINSLEHSSSPGTFGVRAPMNLRRPKRARVYGDGTELDAFDDLDTSREKERIILRNTGSTLKGRGFSSDRNSAIRAGGSTIKASGTIKPSSSSTLNSDRIMSANDEKRSKPGIGSSSRRRIKREPQLIKNMGPTPPNKGLSRFFPFLPLMSDPSTCSAR